jgi:nucleoside-diphosphate-sugar epimerase
MNKKIKVFITGANGFVGYHLVQLLLQRGHIVFAGIHHKKENLLGAVKVFHMDLLDQNTLDEALKEIKPDAIIHLAAVSK